MYVNKGNKMDSVKLLDEIIEYQKRNDKSYPAQEHRLTQLCIRANKIIQDNTNKLLSKYRINDSMFMIMFLLSSMDNSCLSPSDISTYLQTSRTNVTRVTDSLERLGFIRKIDSRDDRRSKYIYLTHEGDLFLQQIIRIQSVYFEKIWCSLTVDEIELFEIISKKLLLSQFKK